MLSLYTLNSDSIRLIVISTFNYALKHSKVSVGWDNPKDSLRGEAFPHIYKVITSLFHNRREITLTISSSHIKLWIGAEITRFSCGLLGRDMLVEYGL
jgi:hypothetical protein